MILLFITLKSFRISISGVRPLRDMCTDLADIESDKDVHVSEERGVHGYEIPETLYDVKT